MAHEAAFGAQFSPQMAQFYYPEAQPLPRNNPPNAHQPQNLPTMASSNAAFEQKEAANSQPVPSDEGLLGDIVPPGMRRR